MTNAEKIRQMTDEELAYLIMPDDYIYCPCHIIGNRKCLEGCTDCVLKWLQEEANDVGNCADCMYSISDGDLGFVCCNGKSEQYGQYSGWCDKYKEADDG